MATIKNRLGQSFPIPLLRNGKVCMVTLPARASISVDESELTPAVRNLHRQGKVKIQD